MIIPVMLVSSLVFSDFRSEWLGNIMALWILLIVIVKQGLRPWNLDLFSTVYGFGGRMCSCPLEMQEDIGGGFSSIGDNKQIGKKKICDA